MLKKTKKQNYFWCTSLPLRAGVYKTRCLRENSEVTNYGYRYYFKDLGWSILLSTREEAKSLGKQKTIGKRDLANTRFKIQYAFPSVRLALSTSTTNLEVATSEVATLGVKQIEEQPALVSAEAVKVMTEVANVLKNNVLAFRRKADGALVCSVSYEDESKYEAVHVISKLSQECLDFFFKFK